MTEMRERFRAQVRDEAKAVALQQLGDGGPAAVSINAIGKALGVSGPALYRYFKNRDALLEALVADAYADLTAAVTGGTDLAAFAAAFRAWALAQPHRYRLLFAAPITDTEDLTAPVVGAAHELMLLLVALLPAEDGAPAPAPKLAEQLRRWAADRPGTIEPAIALRAIGVWSRLHGLVSLEIEGNFASMGLDPDLLFAAEVEGLVTTGPRG